MIRRPVIRKPSAKKTSKRKTSSIDELIRNRRRNTLYTGPANRIGRKSKIWDQLKKYGLNPISFDEMTKIRRKSVTSEIRERKLFLRGAMERPEEARLKQLLRIRHNDELHFSVISKRYFLSVYGSMPSAPLYFEIKSKVIIKRLAEI